MCVRARPVQTVPLILIEITTLKDPANCISRCRTDFEDHAAKTCVIRGILT